MSSKQPNVSIWNITIFILFIVLLGLSMAELILQQNVIHAFKNVKIQYPNSNLSEKLWVSMNPGYIDPNPTTTITIVGAVGVVSAVAGIGWVLGLWWGVGWMMSNALGLVATILVVIFTLVDISVLTYTFVKEAKQVLPDEWSEYRNTQFTREFYLCSAFPAVFENAEQFYGFPACEHAAVARFNLIGLSVIGVILTALCNVQLWSTGLFGKQKSPTGDVETLVANPNNRREQNEAAKVVPHITPGVNLQRGTHEQLPPRIQEYYGKI